MLSSIMLDAFKDLLAMLKIYAGIVGAVLTSTSCQTAAISAYRARELTMQLYY